MKVVIILVLCLICPLFAYSQMPEPEPTPAAVPAPAPLIEDVYLAKDDGNGKAGDTVSSFFTTDIPIHCVVQLDSAKPVTVKMNFVAVAVPGVKAESKVVTTSYTTKGRENRVNFTGKPDGRWNAGKYRVDLFIDGKLVKDIAFEIRPASGSADGATYFQPKTALKPKPAPRPKRNP